MNIAIAGPGLMGSQIGVEYALGGHHTWFLVNRRAEAERRIEEAFGLADGMGLWSAAGIAAARQRVSLVEQVAELPAGIDLVVESIIEDLQAKGAVLRQIGQHLPAAILASNTSAISITALGQAAEAPERTLGTHYWNPPLLMPLVEVIISEQTRPEVTTLVLDTLRKLGKNPVQIDRDVNGFAWNRMQLALMREAVWLVENGVATPGVVDQIVREGLARRWRYTGPFQTAALGGPATFSRVANNLWPLLSNATELHDLPHWLIDDPGQLAAIKANRDAGLLDDLKRDSAAGKEQAT